MVQKKEKENSEQKPLTNVKDIAAKNHITTQATKTGKSVIRKNDPSGLPKLR